jgi:hypothetical protein
MKVSAFPSSSLEARQGRLVAHKDIPAGPSQVDQGRKGIQSPTHLDNAEVSRRDNPAQKGAYPLFWLVRQLNGC